MKMKRDDIIQITDLDDKFYSCLLIVDEVKSWGVQAYMTVPKNGDAYTRVKNGSFEVVGKAKILRPLTSIWG